MKPLARGKRTSRSAGRWALPLGVLILFVDGYDLFVLGTVGPSLLAYKPWGAGPATLGLLGSVTAFGMPIGAFVAGRASDTWGRRLPLMATLAWVSLGMILAGLAPNLTVFGLGRFLTGIGIGALTPLIVAYVADWARPHRRTLHVGLALTGIAIGGLVVAFVGRAVLPGVHFQSLFLVGAIPLLLIPVCWNAIPAGLPDQDISVRAEDGPAAGEPLRELFGPGFRAATILFAIAGFFGLVLVYGASTWLPTLMVQAGYDLRSALEFTMAFNGGAILGTIAAALIADRGHLKSTTVVCFLSAAVAMLVLSSEQARWVILTMSAVAGLGTLGTQNLVNGYVAHFFPARLRGSALGVSLGLGRFGSILGPSYLTLIIVVFAVPAAGFYGFVLPAVLGAIAVGMIPAARRPIASGPVDAARAAREAR
ncbi:MAG: transporter, family, benzoate transport protein [Pseudonocardiales bacterium]|nr:transporter, family, benzoate transport protein [Pseudonocardiales bacterium]